MAVGASHAKLGSSINICEARDICVVRHSSIPLHSTPFEIPDREEQFVETHIITTFHARFIQSQSTQLLSIQAAFLLFGEPIFVCDMHTIRII
jgi:hypothetical protein